MKSFEAKIFVGFKERDTGCIHTIEECESVCQSYVDSIGLCVTVTPTKYIYTNGHEPGAIIGLIQYPRFPTEESQIQEYTLNLATLLLYRFNQYRVTINFPDETIMLTNKIVVNDP